MGFYEIDGKTFLSALEFSILEKQNDAYSLSTTKSWCSMVDTQAVELLSDWLKTEDTGIEWGAGRNTV